MKATLSFDDRGRVMCLYTDAVDLRTLGRLQVSRATDIQFHNPTQQWVVRSAATGRRLYSDPSREACLAWEREHLGPDGNFIESP